MLLLHWAFCKRQNWQVFGSILEVFFHSHWLFKKIICSLSHNDSKDFTESTNSREHSLRFRSYMNSMDKKVFSFFFIGYWDPYSMHWSKMQLHVTVERLRQLWLTLAVFIQHYASFHLAAYRIANQHEHTVNPISGVPDISIYYINRNVSPLQGQKFFAVYFTVPYNQPQFQLRNKLGNRIIL